MGDVGSRGGALDVGPAAEPADRPWRPGWLVLAAVAGAQLVLQVVVSVVTLLGDEPWSVVGAVPWLLIWFWVMVGAWRRVRRPKPVRDVPAA